MTISTGTPLNIPSTPTFAGPCLCVKVAVLPPHFLLERLRVREVAVVDQGQACQGATIPHRAYKQTGVGIGEKKTRAREARERWPRPRRRRPGCGARMRPCVRDTSVCAVLAVVHDGGIRMMLGKWVPGLLRSRECGARLSIACTVRGYRTGN